MFDLIEWSSHGAEGIIGKSSIQLSFKNLDTSTSLALTGTGFKNYGPYQQQNFLRLLENFASATPPLNPTIGQLWFSPAEIALYLCVDIAHAGTFTPAHVTGQKGWINISAMAGSSITGATIVSALGYTPYSNLNPDNYLTSITSSMIDGALGYTPYNGSTNALNFITAATAPVKTVATRTGNIVLTTADLSDFSAEVSSIVTTALAGFSSAPANSSLINPSTPKAGDILVVGSIISIYANGAWAQVFPAIYS